MPEHHLFALVIAVAVLVLMFIVIIWRLFLIMTPEVTGGSWINVLDYVLMGLWPIR